MNKNNAVVYGAEEGRGEGDGAAGRGLDKSI